VSDRIKLAQESDGALRDARLDTTVYFEQKRIEATREQ
jgi:hypothetical protein